MTTTQPVIETLEVKNYKALIMERPQKTRFSYKEHPYLVRSIKLTPKAKYSSDTVLSNEVYRTIEEAKQAASKWIDGIRANIEDRQQQRQARRDADKSVKAEDFYKVGDIIVNTWGWEQTNVSFYQVVKVGNKTIDIEQIYAATVSGSEEQHGMADRVVAQKDAFKPDGDKYTLRVKAGGWLSNPESYYHMHKWDGRPEYRSWYA